MPVAADPQWARLADAIAGPGHLVEANFASSSEVAALAVALQARAAAGMFRDAAVGAGDSRRVRPEIRGDRISWLDAAETPAEVALFARLEALRDCLNRSLMLGLSQLELHYALYPPGRHYVRHLDLSPQGLERVVTVTLYLNEDWIAADGGELVIAADAGEVAVLPVGGTLVAFLSARFEHEVRSARRERLSLTGWFSRRRSSGGRLT